MALDTIDDLRAAAKTLREEASKLQSHLKRMMTEYGDFEDRINELDKVIAQAEIETGITKEEIIKPVSVIDNFLEDLE